MHSGQSDTADIMLFSDLPILKILTLCYQNVKFPLCYQNVIFPVVI